MRPKHEHDEILADLYPEVAAGGLSRVNGTVGFYQRVNALLSSDMTVVDFGAGRGRASEDPVSYRRELQRLRGKVRRVIGLDVDHAILENPWVDEAHVIETGRSLPIESGTVDIVVSDFTFEHVSQPEWTAGELKRVLRSGGWICARTPNKWGYIGIPTRLVPNRWHTSVLHRVQPQKADQDTFPTVYRMNTRGDLRKWFPESDFSTAHME